MGIYLADQTMVFLQSVAVGVLLGVLYDAFRISRIALPTPPAAVFVEDVVYFLICAVITFLLMMTVLDGQLRFFLFLGELIGGSLYYCTVGRLVMRVSRAIIRGIRAVAGFFTRYLFMPLWRVLYGMISIILRPVYFLGKILKKRLQKMKFRLKVGRRVLYNACKEMIHGKVRRKKPKAQEEVYETGQG